jgi:hypothetical protein
MAVSWPTSGTTTRAPSRSPWSWTARQALSGSARAPSPPTPLKSLLRKAGVFQPESAVSEAVGTVTDAVKSTAKKAGSTAKRAGSAVKDAAASVAETVSRRRPSVAETVTDAAGERRRDGAREGLRRGRGGAGARVRRRGEAPAATPRPCGSRADRRRAEPAVAEPAEATRSRRRKARMAGAPRSDAGGEPGWLVVGTVRKPHGVRGELQLALETDRPDAVFRKGRVLELGDERGPGGAAVTPSGRPGRSRTVSSSRSSRSPRATRRSRSCGACPC